MKISEAKYGTIDPFPPSVSHKKGQSKKSSTVAKSTSDTESGAKAM